jgi:hypothetical protein
LERVVNFNITRNDRTVEAVYSNDEPRVDGFGEHRDDRYRISASYFTPRERGNYSHAMQFCIQHLKMSNTPYSYAELPGRIVLRDVIVARESELRGKDGES